MKRTIAVLAIKSVVMGVIAACLVTACGSQKNQANDQKAKQNSEPAYTFTPMKFDTAQKVSQQQLIKSLKNIGKPDKALKSAAQAVLSGVNNLTGPEVVTSFLTVGSDCVPILFTPGTLNQQAFVVAATYGKGRILILDKEFCQVEKWSGKADNDKFYANAVKWVTNNGTSKGHYIVGGKMKSWYTQNGFGKNLATSRKQPLEDAGLIHLSGISGNPKVIAAYKKAVENGAGLIMPPPSTWYGSHKAIREFLSDIGVRQLDGKLVRCIHKRYNMMPVKKLLQVKKSPLQQLAELSFSDYDSFTSKLDRRSASFLLTELTTYSKIVAESQKQSKRALVGKLLQFAYRLTPSPQEPVKNSISKALLVFEDNWLKSLSHEQLLKYGAHRASVSLGEIPVDAKIESCKVKLYSNPKKLLNEMVSTACYALPGKEVIVKLPQAMLDKKLKIQIGHHGNGERFISADFPVMPNTTRYFNADKTIVKLINPHGGLIYIVTPKVVGFNGDEIEVIGAVEAPRYYLGKTTKEQWKKIRNLPGAWGELISKQTHFIVPSAKLRTIENPEEMMSWWSTSTKQHEEFYNYKPEVPYHQHIRHYADSGRAYWPFQWSMNHMEGLFNVKGLKLHNSGLFLHEHGHHADDARMFVGKIGESTPNWAGYYMKATYGDFAWKSTTDEHLTRLFDPKDKLHQEIRVDKWWETSFTHHWSYPMTSVVNGYAHTFGWDNFKKCVHAFTYLDRNEVKTDQQKIDKWLIFMSQNARKDIRLYMAHFHWKPSPETDRKIDAMKLPKWDLVYCPKRVVVVTEGESVALANPDQFALTAAGRVRSVWGKNSNGTLKANDDGSALYTPERGFTGVDNVTYKVTNKYGNVTDAAVEIHVVKADRDPKLMLGEVDGVNTSDWKKITFTRSYKKPIVVASADPSVNPNFVTRLRNITSSGCEVKLQQIKGTPGSTSCKVTWCVMEEGEYRGEGVIARAGLVEASPEPLSKAAEGVLEVFGHDVPMARTARFGQVMSYNDSRWSTFFRKPASAEMGTRFGCHTGDDTTSRKAETVGYICLSQGYYQSGNSQFYISNGSIRNGDVQLKTSYDSLRGWGFSKMVKYYTTK